MNVPPPISAGRVVTEWAVDPVALVLVTVAAGLYVAGVRRLSARGHRWPAARSAAFGCGLAVLAVATMSGLAAYENVLFSVHATQHLLLGMVAPLLLVLAAPVTLLLQAARRPTQVFAIGVVRSPAVQAVTHPVTAACLFGTTMVLLYFTPLYELSLRNDLVHAWLHVHFVVVGLLFFWVVVGIDVGTRPLPPWARLGLVLTVIPFHAFVGVAILMSDHLLAADWYLALDRPWGADALADQRTGAGILWGVGDLLGVLAVGVLLVRWMGEDRAGRVDSSYHDRRLSIDRDALPDFTTTRRSRPDPTMSA